MVVTIEVIVYAVLFTLKIVLACCVSLLVLFCNPSFRRWFERAILMKAFAVSKRGVWVDDPTYWTNVDPRDRVSPRSSSSSQDADMMKRRGDGKRSHERAADVRRRASATNSHRARQSHLSPPSDDACPMLIPA